MHDVDLWIANRGSGVKDSPSGHLYFRYIDTDSAADQPKYTTVIQLIVFLKEKGVVIDNGTVIHFIYPVSGNISFVTSYPQESLVVGMKMLSSSQFAVQFLPTNSSGQLLKMVEKEILVLNSSITFELKISTGHQLY